MSAIQPKSVWFYDHVQILCIFYKTFYELISIICGKCGSKGKRRFEKEESFKLFKVLALIKIYNYFKDVVEENISEELRQKNIEEMKKYLI